MECTGIEDGQDHVTVRRLTNRAIEGLNRQYAKKCDLPVRYGGPDREHTKIQRNLLLLLPIDTVAMVVVAKYVVQVL
jgi:hypothetical protein